MGGRRCLPRVYPGGFIFLLATAALLGSATALPASDPGTAVAHLLTHLFTMQRGRLLQEMDMTDPAAMYQMGYSQYCSSPSQKAQARQALQAQLASGDSEAASMVNVERVVECLCNNLDLDDPALAALAPALGPMFDDENPNQEAAMRVGLPAIERALPVIMSSRILCSDKCKSAMSDYIRAFSTNQNGGAAGASELANAADEAATCICEMDWAGMLHGVEPALFAASHQTRRLQDHMMQLEEAPLKVYLVQH